VLKKFNTVADAVFKTVSASTQNMAESSDHSAHAKKVENMLLGIMETQKVLQEQQEALRLLCSTQAPAFTPAPTAGSAAGCQAPTAGSAAGCQQRVEGGASSRRRRGQPRAREARKPRARKREQSKQDKPKREREHPVLFDLLHQDIQAMANKIVIWHCQLHPDGGEDTEPDDDEHTERNENAAEYRNAEKEPAEHSDAEKEPAEHSDAEKEPAEHSDAENDSGEDSTDVDWEETTGMGTSQKNDPCWNSSLMCWESYVFDTFHDWRENWDFLDLSDLSDEAKEHLKKCTLATFVDKVQYWIDSYWNVDHRGPQNMVQWSTDLVDLFVPKA